MNYSISTKSECGKCEYVNETVHFVANNDYPEARFFLDVDFLDWEEDCYIFIPACAYDGNRADFAIRKYPPRVFTEQGVAMLATILKSDVATIVSIKIMDAFVALHHYIGDSEYRLSNVERKILEYDSEIKLLKESFDKLQEKRKVNEIYFDGQIYDAYSKIQDIFKNATKRLIIIDTYADNTLLDIVKRLNIQVIIITKKDNLLTYQDIKKYNKQYHNLKVIYNNTFHDRYFIVDDDIYHCGASINRIGYKTFSITLLKDKDICLLLMERVCEII